MYLIKSCPSCHEKLRFPINSGKIKVRCKCGHTFIANPDAPSLYKGAKFDIKPDQKKSGLKKKLGEIRKGKGLENILPEMINAFLEFKYRILNFPILPDSEKRKTIIYFLVIIILIILISVAILLLSSPGKMEGTVI